MCFSLAWFEALLIWLIIVCGIVAIFRLVLPVVLGWLGIAGGLVMQVLNIILVVIVLCMLVYFAFDLISCAGSIRMGLR